MEYCRSRLPIASRRFSNKSEIDWNEVIENLDDEDENLDEDENNNEKNN